MQVVGHVFFDFRFIAIRHYGSVFGIRMSSSPKSISVQNGSGL